jgi:hypothetical protein
MKITDEMVKKFSLPPTEDRMIKMRRCMCGRMLRADEDARRWYSGVVNYDEMLCDSCRKDYGDKARLVCLGCKSLQGFMDPQRAKTGFVFEGKKHYHLGRCISCAPDIKATAVLEHERWICARGMVSKVNLDLLQEIEQKTLQGVAEVDKLRQEINSAST